MQFIKNEWNMMWNAGTLLWSRIKLTLGLVGTAITNSGVDLSTIISDAKVLAATKIGLALIAADGVISEMVRRHGATDLSPPNPPAQ